MTIAYSIDSEIKRNLQQGLEESLSKGASDQIIQDYIEAGAVIPSWHPLSNKKLNINFPKQNKSTTSRFTKKSFKERFGVSKEDVFWPAFFFSVIIGWTGLVILVQAVDAKPIPQHSITQLNKNS